jgi:phosphatidylglycerophosphate synthase
MRDSLEINASRWLMLMGAGAAVAAIVVMRVAGLGWLGPVTALFTYAAIAILVLHRLPEHAPHRRFGPANAVTLLRAALVALLFGVVAAGQGFGDVERWLLVTVSSVLLLLDGVDGWAARRSGMASGFGARFDMEVDAVFVLALAALVWRVGQAGSWVLLSGLLRYIFVLAGRRWPMLAAPLPPSFRRKSICVVQILALLVALAPPTGAGIAQFLCLGGLVLLVYSFVADCLRLAAMPAPQRPAEEMTT